MEFTVKKIEEKIVHTDEDEEATKFVTRFENTDGELTLSLKELGTSTFNIGDKIELKKIESQTTLVPIKRGRPKKVVE
jgi:hypothetical protein